eukprot:scaffold22058_cov124-Isochrysis_galbana.AAC.1
MSISAYASDLSAASPSHSCEFTQSHPSPSSGMVQPVVNEMFATVHAAGSSLLGLFTSCATFDSTRLWQCLACAPLGAQAVVLCWCSGHAEAACVALGLTMLLFTGLRGWLGGSGMAMLNVVGAQAEGAARASAGCSSMRT